MLNKEKYAKEIVDIAVGGWCLGLKNGKPFKCVCLRCEECDFGGGDCSTKFAEWANSEYVEPAVDWSKVPVDTPILVRNLEDYKWQHRHFAKYEDGGVYAWNNGVTSWSAKDKDCSSFWVFAKLAESEDD